MITTAIEMAKQLKDIVTNTSYSGGTETIATTLTQSADLLVAQDKRISDLLIENDGLTASEAGLHKMVTDLESRNQELQQQGQTVRMVADMEHENVVRLEAQLSKMEPPRNSPKILEAARKVVEKFKAMSEEEFEAELKKHENGEFALMLQEVWGLNRQPPTFTYSAWEADEFVISKDGKPIGGTLHKRDAIIVSDFLNRSYKEIVGE